MKDELKHDCCSLKLEIPTLSICGLYHLQEVEGKTPKEVATTK